MHGAGADSASNDGRGGQGERDQRRRGFSPSGAGDTSASSPSRSGFVVFCSPYDIRVVYETTSDNKR